MNIKKGIAGILCMALILSAANVFGADISQISEEKISNINLVSQDNSEKVFKGSDLEKSIKYDYQIDSEDEEGNYSATLSFILPIDNQEKTVTVSGILSSTQDPSGEVFLEGPLEGDIVLNGLNYNVVAGVTKSVTTGKMNAGITLSTNDKWDEQIMFSFGDKIVRQLDNKEANPLSPDALPRASSTFKEVVTGSSAISGASSSGPVLKLRGLYQQSSKRASVGINSNISGLKTYYKNKNKVSTVNARIHSLRIELERDSNINPGSYIAGIEKPNLSVGSTGQTPLKPIFQDACTLIGIPSAAIISAINDAEGNIDYHHSTNNTYVNVTFSGTSKANFDSASVTLPVIFQLNRTTASKSAKEAYNFKARMRYYVNFNIPLSGSTTFYADAVNISKSCTLTI